MIFVLIFYVFSIFHNDYIKINSNKKSHNFFLIKIIPQQQFLNFFAHVNIFLFLLAKILNELSSVNI
jgi:hypothetical protein